MMNPNSALVLLWAYFGDRLRDQGRLKQVLLKIASTAVSAQRITDANMDFLIELQPDFKRIFAGLSASDHLTMKIER